MGIFFLVGREVLFDCTPITEASKYDQFWIHEKSHEQFWSELVRDSRVPQAEYDEIPRGRVMYDEKKKAYSVLADRCILRNRAYLKEIVEVMTLPIRQTVVAWDDHYRCPKCLRGQED